MWLFFAFLAPMLYGIANVADNLLANRHFKNPAVLAFYASLLAVVFIPVAFLFYPFAAPPVSLIPIFVLLGIINVAYLYPYYQGLKNDDTSTAVSFFGLGRIFIPMWAFLIVGEHLSFSEYIGVGLIIIGSISLSFRGSFKQLRFSKAALYILLAAFIISFEGVLLKYLFTHGVSAGVGAAGEVLASACSALLLLVHKGTRRDVVASFNTFRKKLPLLFVEEGATFGAFFAGSVALSLAPVSLTKSITSLTPIFVLLYAKALGKKWPQLFNEQKGLGITFKKASLFLVIALGVFLIAQ